jgi:hypothetical protein
MVKAAFMSLRHVSRMPSATDAGAKPSDSSKGTVVMSWVKVLAGAGAAQVRTSDYQSPIGFRWSFDDLPVSH